MKVVKPFIDRPFYPQEVASVEPFVVRAFSNQAQMTSAILVGPNQRSNGEVDEVRNIL